MPEKGIVLGLDLTCSERRASAYALLDLEPRLVEAGFTGKDGDILALAQRAKPARVAIDAPLSLPPGLGCLEEPCTCGQCLPGPAKIRACELDLRRQRGVGCFFTTKRSIIKPLAYRGIALRKALEGRGHKVLEVYPYATKVALWGRRGVKAWGIPKKNTPQGLVFLKEQLGCLIPGLDTANLNHDLCDAILSAYTGCLALLGQAHQVGDDEEGAIWAPDYTPSSKG